MRTILPLIFLAGLPVDAATYYVATTGSDSTGNGSSGNPYATVYKGVNVATSPDDVVIVKDGTYGNNGEVWGTGGPHYNGLSVARFTSSGTSGHPITLRAENRGGAILDGGNTNSSATCNGVYAYLDLYTSHDVVVQGFIIQHTCQEGIHSNDSAHGITIRWNELRNIANHLTGNDQVGKDGIYLNPACYNFTFDGNTFHDIGRTGFDGSYGLLRHFDHGIYTEANSGLVIKNNIFYNMSAGYPMQFHGSAAHAGDGGIGYVVQNNTFANNVLNTGESGNIALWGAFSVALTIQDNIFYQTPGQVFNIYQVTGPSSCTFSYNLTYPTIGPGGVCTASNGVTGDPKFASVASSNFTLQVGSPAIDAGANTGVNPDIVGTSRPQGAGYDIGAYETATACTITPPALGPWQVGQVISVQVSASGGCGSSPSWSVSSGSLPAGLSINSSTGTISGTVGGASGTFTPTIAYGTGSQAYSITVNPQQQPLPSYGFSINGIPEQMISGIPFGDCSSIGHVQKINQDGTVTCTADGAAGVQLIASGQTAMPTGAVSANTCSGSATTATATGALTTDAMAVTYASDPTGRTGYGGGTGGGITVRYWITANTVNFKLCNETGSSITPGALSVNWRIVR